MRTKAEKVRLLLLLSVLVLAVPLYFGLQNVRMRSVLKKRFADVSALTAAYAEVPSAKDIGDLFAVLKRENIKLYNPIPQDPSKPCYRLASSAIGLQGKTPSDENPNSVLIEETNVTDSRLIVMSLRDGSVMARSRTDIAFR